MPKETTDSGILGELARVSRTLAENAAEIPLIEGPRIRLEEVLGEAQQVTQLLASLTASKQDAARRKRALLVEGQRLITAITRLLQERYGNRSEKMAEFGIQPFRGRKPRTPKQPVPEPPAPTPPAPEVRAAHDNPKL